MGLFHCVQAGCVEVRYKPYIKGGGIRYRYPGEEWIETNGDDYSIDTLYGFGEWHIFGTAISKTKGFFCDEAIKIRTIDSIGGRPISVEGDYKYNESPPNFAFKITYEAYGSQRVTYRTAYYTGSPGRYLKASRMKLSDTCKSDQYYIQPGSANNFFFADRRENQNPNDDNKYNFRIYKNKQEILSISSFQEPEVEKLVDGLDGCQLSDRTQVIRVEKLPFLDRVEVTDFDYQNFGTNVYRAPIPNHCLVVRNNSTTAIPPLPIPIGTPSNSAPSQDFTYGFVQLICSSEGCPPPEYEVICNCEGEECPNGTCPTECGGTVCCYDTTTGQSVAEIPLENYRGGGL